MNSGSYRFRKGKILLLISVAGMLSACGRTQRTRIEEPETVDIGGDASSETETAAGENATAENVAAEEPDAAVENVTEETIAEDEKKELFGKDCIAEQTFEVELSEYEGMVYFVPFAPSGENPDFRMQIVQNGEVLTDISGYVPDSLAGETFASLDAVSFYDVNYDGYTDIVLTQTYGSTSFAAVYYGYYEAYEENTIRYFSLEQTLSDNITKSLETLTMPEIRNLLSGGKKNGEFVDYKEAYKAVANLCALESDSEIEYDVIYVDGDEIPELVSGHTGYSVSLYTYDAGTVYPLMLKWGYGAMGNVGYEYAPERNNIRNYNSDYAGLIMYTTYMAVGKNHTLDVTAQITTCNFDDVNGNGIPDEDEEASFGNYSVSFLDGTEVSAEECAAYDAEKYEYIVGSLRLEELLSKIEGMD